GGAARPEGRAQPRLDPAQGALGALARRGDGAAPRAAREDEGQQGIPGEHVEWRLNPPSFPQPPVLQPKPPAPERTEPLVPSRRCLAKFLTIQARPGVLAWHGAR